MTTPRADIARPFLESVLPTLQGDERYWGEAFISKGAAPSPRISLHVKDLVAFFEKHSASGDVYFSPVAFKSAGKGRRGNNVARCRVVWADLDVGPGKGHATVADVISALKTFPLKPTWVISSGRGVHVYWLLVEEVEEDDFPRLMAVVRGLALHLGGDLAATLRTQILRPPGTLNHKPGGPYPVEVLHHFLDAPELSLDDFEEWVTPNPESAYQARSTSTDTGGGEWDGPPANLERIVGGCAWLRHTRDDAAKLAEPEWYGMLGIVARTDGGDTACHDWSRPHPAYTARETDYKVRHALEAAGPRTCATIADDFGAERCNGCAFKDRVKSPIQIGSGGFADRRGGTDWTWGKEHRQREERAQGEQPPPPWEAAHIDWGTFWDTDRRGEDWLVEPLLPRGRRITTYAAAKEGKSLLALDIAARVATGRRCLDRPAGEPVSVVYFDLEMTEDDLYERLQDMGYGPDDDLSHLHYYLLPNLPPLNTPEGGLAVQSLADKHAAELVVIDTTSAALDGPENDSDTLRDFGRFTATPLKARGITVWRLDHAGKDVSRGQRGTSAKNDGEDLIWLLSASEGGATLKATHRRQGWIPQSVELVRLEDPLRHSQGGYTWPQGTTEAAALLEKHGVPVDVSVREARRALAKLGVKVAQGVLAAAVKWRKEHRDEARNTSRNTSFEDERNGERNGGSTDSRNGPVTARNTDLDSSVTDYVPKDVTVRSRTFFEPSDPHPCIDCGEAIRGTGDKCADCAGAAALTKGKARR